MLGDESDYALLVLPEAALTVSLNESDTSALRLRFFGNRQGVASLASILLWLHANAYRCEFLSITALPFVQTENQLVLVVRISLVESNGKFGCLHRLDYASEFEWELPEDDLQRFALRLHYLTSVPEHEYELFELTPLNNAHLEVRLCDVSNLF